MLAVSLFAEQPRRLRARLRLLEGRVPWVELRLDRLPADLDLGALRAEFPGLRFLAACRPLEAGATRARAEALRRAAAAGFDRLDFPLDETPPAWAAATPWIRSLHETPGAALDLAARLRLAREQARPGDWIKLVAHADCAEQALRVLSLYAAAPRGSLIAFAMGAGGAATRLWSAAYGAPIVFACWPGEETAPGQLDWRTLLDLLPDAAAPQPPLYGVLGRPVAHSLSPRLWSAAFRGESPPVGATYAPCAAQDLSAFLAAAADLPCAAFSITAPFKEEAFRLASGADPIATACRAANFLQREGAGWRACNTDGAAALDALVAAGLRLPARVLILGAGGAARAAAAEALRRGCRVEIAARRPEQARALAEDLRGAGLLAPPASVQAVALDAADFAGSEAVIQATTVGSRAQPGNPAPSARLAPGARVLEMVYDPPRTEFLARAEAQGAHGVGGAEMLARQMVAQYALARGRAPDLARMLHVLRRALAERDPDPRRALALIGPRASGKSTLGLGVAERLGRRFVDADLELERRSGRAIAEWLPADAAGFRAAEAALLPELLAQPATVIAFGGGVVEDADARAALAAHGATLWLHATPAEQLRRRSGGDLRPALTGLPLEQEIAQVHERRLPWYRACATLCVEVDGAPEEALAALWEGIREIGLTTSDFDR